MAKIEENNSILKENSKKYASQIWSLMVTQIEKHTSKGEKIVPQPAPPKEQPKRKWLIKVLFFFPFLLLLGFVTSFWWNFDNIRLFIFGYTILLEGILKILTISGLIGFMTNWVAIKMLFRPTFRRPILGQGLIPAQKERIAFRLASAVSEDLINPELIKKKIHHSKAISTYLDKSITYIKNIIDEPSFRSELKILLVSYVDDVISETEVRASISKGILDQINKTIDENSFERVALKAYSFFKGQEIQAIIDEALKKLPTGIEQGVDNIDALLDSIPAQIEKNMDTLEELITSLLFRLVNQLDVHALVEDNLRQYDEKRIELLIKNASNEQLRYIQYLGAVLGTVGGFIIWKPIASLAIISSIISIIFGTDYLLFKLQSASKID